MSATTLFYKSGGFALTMPEDDRSGDGSLIAGYASTFGLPADLVGDVIDPGAYASSLRARPTVPVLYQHSSEEPIGKATLAEDKHGLLFTARLSSSRRANDTKALVRDGILSGISIGFSIPPGGSQHGPGGDWLRTLKAIDLHEISVVTWPANPSAQILEVRSKLAGTFRDMHLIADIDQKRAAGMFISKGQNLAYVKAWQRQLERESYGKTRHELLYDLRYELQELEMSEQKIRRAA